MRLIIALFILLVSGVSCTKSYCWQCAIKDHIIYQNTTETDVTHETEKCDMTEKEIREYEQSNSYTKTSADGDYRTITTTNCSRK